MEPRIVEKLSKLFPLLSSNHDGEVVATARAIERTLKKSGHSLHDLAGAMKDRSAERDRPEANKTAGQGNGATAGSSPRDTSIRWTDAMRRCALLLGCALNDVERGFISKIQDNAQKYRARFSLTQKQIAWLLRLEAAHLSDPEAPTRQKRNSAEREGA